MIDSALTFDPELHIYRYEGRVIPSVTDVMKPISDFSMVRRDVLARAQDRGSKAHAATQFWDEDDLDEESVDEVLLPFVRAHVAFRRESGFVPLEIERTVIHPGYGYAGTADRFGTYHGRRCVLDYKTGGEGARLTPKVGVQLAAYQAAINAELPAKDRYGVRLGVMLRADGSYEVRRYESWSDWPCFLALLNVHRWRMTHGA